MKQRRRAYLDDLSHVLTAKGISITCRTLHENVDQFMKHNNGNLVRFENEHVRLNRLLRNRSLVLSTYEQNSLHPLDVQLLITNGLGERIKPFG